MRLAPVVTLLLCAVVAFAAPAVRIRLPAAPPRFLYDEAGVLSAGERGAIEDTLMALDRRGIEIGVAIFKSIDDEPIEDVSLALAEKWKPGSKEKDNGALIVVALKERGVRIEVGYGLEPRVPDAVAGRIIRYDMAPAFRDGRFGDGISRAVSSLARAAAGEALPPPTDQGPPPWAALIALFVMLPVILLIARLNRHRGYAGRGGVYRGRGGPWWFAGGGGFGGGGGGFGGGSFGGGSFGGGGASGGW